LKNPDVVRVHRLFSKDFCTVLVQIFGAKTVDWKNIFEKILVLTSH